MRRHRTTALIAVAAVSLLLAACGTGRISFDKPGVPVAERERDQKECALASADDPDHGQILLVFRIDRDAYARCMASRGYTVMRGSKIASR
jgi:hypothetical protein